MMHRMNLITINPGDIVEPWTGNGWPVDLFINPEEIKDEEKLFCGFKKCVRRVLRDPFQMNCGHRVCKACLEHIKTLPQVEQICDQCAMEPRNCGYTNTWPPGTLFGEFGGFSYDAVPSARNTYGRYDPYPKCYLDYCIIDFDNCSRDNAVKRQINRISVQCPYCGVKLIVRALERHMHRCEERLVPCEKCVQPVTFSRLTKHVEEECLLREVSCQNGCGVTGLLGRDLYHHSLECVKKPIKCEFCNGVYSFDTGRKAHLLHCVAYSPDTCGQVVNQDVNLSVQCQPSD
ncbi:hypothetical protein EB796_021140 [Bugula neritina]|uniref:TRAF-type domain-containing protein n=1 Tax=Bugula neritina TaxID=10212 RepID=A0A7J7J303_BUGNE|nr:hypothetical protein EB796_021140 [Bugula neritina]